jgi:hypothetical protein
MQCTKETFHNMDSDTIRGNMDVCLLHTSLCKVEFPFENQSLSLSVAFC